jgi:uncharacterized protein (TIGR02300 family)
MPAKDLGIKHSCWKCGTKFYDLKKPSPACPKCGADPRQAPVVKAPTAAEKKRAAKAAVPAEVPEVVEEAELDEELDDPEEEVAEEADDE